MKLEILQKIITHIEKNIPCPQCKGNLISKNMDLSLVQEGHIEFIINCKKCEAHPRVTVHLKEKINQEPNGLADENLQKLKAISTQLQDFEGDSIEKLFE